jgi:hypothetical protein
MKGLGKKNAVVEGRERKRASASKVGVATAQVKRLVLMRVPITEKYRGAEGEAFICLGQTVLRKWNDESVRLSKVEVVGKVMMMGWEVNGLASVMTKSAKLKAEVAGAGVVVMIETLEAAVVVETLAVAVEDGKVTMA